METVNQFSDITLFVMIFISIGLGWALGYSSGVIAGYNHAKAEGVDSYPIANVYFFATENEDEYIFVDALTNEHILKGSFDDCTKKFTLAGKDRVVFMKGTDE